MVAPDRDHRQVRRLLPALHPVPRGAGVVATTAGEVAVARDREVRRCVDAHAVGGLVARGVVAREPRLRPERLAHDRGAAVAGRDPAVLRAVRVDVRDRLAGVPHPGGEEPSDRPVRRDHELVVVTAERGRATVDDDPVDVQPLEVERERRERLRRAGRDRRGGRDAPRRPCVAQRDPVVAHVVAGVADRREQAVAGGLATRCAVGRGGRSRRTGRHQPEGHRRHDADRERGAATRDHGCHLPGSLPRR